MNYYIITVTASGANSRKFLYAELPDFFENGPVLEYTTITAIQRICARYLKSDKYYVIVQKISRKDMDWHVPITRGMVDVIKMISGCILFKSIQKPNGCSAITEVPIL